MVYKFWYWYVSIMKVYTMNACYEVVDELMSSVVEVE